jgi:membrane-bound lytic murein transglycosylase A
LVGCPNPKRALFLRHQVLGFGLFMFLVSGACKPLPPTPQTSAPPQPTIPPRELSAPSEAPSPTPERRILAQPLTLLNEPEIPYLDDDLDHESLKTAVGQSLAYLGRLPSSRSFTYGDRTVSVAEFKETLQSLLRLLEETSSPKGLLQRMREDYIWFQAAGSDSAGSVLFTGYYVPLLEGRLKAAPGFSYPIYRMPPDMLEIDTGAFRSRNRGERLVGRLQGNKLVPYYTRAEIDKKGKLRGKGLEMAWLKDPIDRFFLHIQGSGQILLEGGEFLNVNYAGCNGHSYRSIGKILLDEGSIPREEMSMQAIRAYLKAHPERMDELLLSDPSYVFFRVVDKGPLGCLEVPLTPGRSIATDRRVFPQGGLAFIRAERPIVDSDGSITEWRRFSRLVLNQDTGGAIQGAGRVDLFCGSGVQAETTAGYLQHKGELYFLLRK